MGWAGAGLLLVFLVSSVSSVRADVPPPPKAKKSPVQVVSTQTGARYAPFVVRRGADRQYSRIIIPREYLPVVAPAEATPQSAPASLRRRSINAGIVLSTVIAVGFLAVVFVRRRKVGWAMAGATALVAVVVVLAGTAVADLAVPGRTPSRSPPPRQVSPATPQILVETTDSGDEVILIVGKTLPHNTR